MYRPSFAHRLATLALLIAVFVVIPVADAALCALEGEATHLSLAVDEDGHEDDNLFDLSQGHCEHGHCHHTTSHVSTDILASGTWRHAHHWPEYDTAVSYTPDGLKRPPKA